MLSSGQLDTSPHNYSPPYAGSFYVGDVGELFPQGFYPPPPPQQPQVAGFPLSQFLISCKVLILPSLLPPQDAGFLFQLSVPPPPTLHTLCCVSYFLFPCQEKGSPYIFLRGGGEGGRCRVSVHSRSRVFPTIC